MCGFYFFLFVGLLLFFVVIVVTVVILFCVQMSLSALCQDSHEKCNYWASEGECSNNPTWMLNNCHLSCNVCKEGKKNKDFIRITLTCSCCSLYIYLFIYLFVYKYYVLVALCIEYKKKIYVIVAVLSHLNPENLSILV